MLAQADSFVDVGEDVGGESDEEEKADSTEESRSSVSSSRFRESGNTEQGPAERDSTGTGYTETVNPLRGVAEIGVEVEIEMTDWGQQWRQDAPQERGTDVDDGDDDTEAATEATGITSQDQGTQGYDQGHEEEEEGGEANGARGPKNETAGDVP